MKKIKEFTGLIVELLKIGKNDIDLSIYLDWFIEKIKKQFLEKSYFIIPKKGEIFYVNLGQNIGHELNKIRPCVVYSKRKFNAGGTIIVIPLRSYKGKDKKNFIKLKPSKNNNLGKYSLVDVFAIKQVDKKRLLNRVGSLEKEYLDQIDNILIKILDIKK